MRAPTDLPDAPRPSTATASGTPVAHRRPGRRPGRGTVRLALVMVVAAASFGWPVPNGAAGQAVAHDLLAAESTPASDKALDRLRRDLGAVLSLRVTPDATCLSAQVDDDLIFQSKSNARLVPASLMKIVTASAALEIMSPAEVFKTAVFVRADALASVADGVLAGDIYLVGGGDPVLSTPHCIERYPEPVAHTDITELAARVFDALAAAGITRVEGRVVGDDSWFPDRERDYTGHYVSGASEAVWKRSFVALNAVGQLSGLLLNDGFSSYSGSTTTAGQQRNVRAADPAQHAAKVFDDLLEARGTVITMRPASGLAPPPTARTALGSIASPPLSEILVRLLSRSDNTTAEMLLKNVGRLTGGSARSAATSSVKEIVQQRLGPLADGLVVADGSGLSSHNRLTCAAIVELLGRSGPGSPLVEGLAVAGERGTLRLCGTAVAGQDQHNAIRAKTGRLNQVSALAGTTVASNGEVLTFAMMANRPFITGLGSCNSIRRGLLNAAARYTYRDLPPNGPVHSGDRESLVALFDAAGGDDWFNAWGWQTDLPLTRWHGVTTSPSGRVVEIDLGGPFGNGLTGVLPEELGALSELRRLDLSRNELVGRLPARIADPATLSELRLAGNSLCLPRSLRSSQPRFDGISDTPVFLCTSFGDTLGHDHAETFEILAGSGVLEGTECLENRICPDDPIVRRTLAVWLPRVLGHGEPENPSASRFADVDSRVPWAAHVERFAELGLTWGCAVDPLRFCPHTDVTRGQMAAFINRGLELPAASASIADTAGHYFGNDMSAVVAAGIMHPCTQEPASFCSQTVLTRGQAATILVRVQRFVTAR